MIIVIIIPHEKISAIIEIVLPLTTIKKFFNKSFDLEFGIWIVIVHLVVYVNDQASP